MGFHHHPTRKEIPFPPDSVEAVAPILAKRKRLCSKDLGSSMKKMRIMMVVIVVMMMNL